MAKEKIKRDLYIKALDGANELVTLCIPSSVQYKQRHKSEPDNLPDLVFNKRVVVRVHKDEEEKIRIREIEGYLLCRLLDYEAINHKWCVNTDLIMQVVDNSTSSLDRYIGRLITSKYGGKHSFIFCDKFQVISFKWQDYFKKEKKGRLPKNSSE